MLDAASDCALDRPDTADAVELLGSLVDKSLVDAVLLDDGPGRYRLLETVREYAARHLDARGPDASTAARTAHMRHFLAVVEHAAPGLESAEQAAWYQRLAPDDGNIRAAVDWAIDTGTDEAVVRFVVALRPYWSHCSVVIPFIRVAEAAADVADAASRPAVLECLGSLYEAAGRPGDAATTYTLMETGAREVGDERALALALNGSAWMLLHRGELDAARARGGEALAMAHRAGDELACARCELTLGAVASAADDIEAARDHFSRGLDHARSCGHVRAEGVLRANLAYIAAQVGDLDAAGAHQSAAWEILEHSGDEHATGYWYLNSGIFRGMAGDEPRAVDQFRLALVAAHHGTDHVLAASAASGIARCWSDRAPERAATLVGFVDATVARLDYTLPPLEALARDTAARVVLGALGPEEFERCCRLGATLNDATLLSFVSDTDRTIIASDRT
jgi:tetratricopeptide (TPR) repeat protein